MKTGLTPHTFCLNEVLGASWQVLLSVTGSFFVRNFVWIQTHKIHLLQIMLLLPLTLCVLMTRPLSTCCLLFQYYSHAPQCNALSRVFAGLIVSICKHWKEKKKFQYWICILNMPHGSITEPHTIMNITRTSTMPFIVIYWW